MKISQLKIKSNNIKKVSEFISNQLSLDYFNQNDAHILGKVISINIK